MTTPADSSASGSDWRSRWSSQRMLMVCVAGTAVLAAVVWSAISARQHVRIPLVGQLSQTPDGEVIALFKSNGIEIVDIDDGTLKIAAADEVRCRQFLQEVSASQATWADEWQKANDQLTPFSSASERSAAREIARARRISQMLSEMPGVQHADIVWDEQAGRGFRRESTVRATVYIRPEAGSQLTPQVVASIREAVAGSKANLAVDDVIVMDLSTGMTHHSETDATDAVLITAEALQPATGEPTAATTTTSTAELSTEESVSTSVQTLPLLSPSVAVRDLAANSEILSRPILIAELPDEGNVAPRVSASTPVIEDSSETPLSPNRTSSNPLGVIRLDEAIVAVDAGAPETDRPAVPRRNRHSNTEELAAEIRGWLGIKSSSDIRFLAWAGIGVLVLIALIRGMIQRPIENRLPDLSMTPQPQPESVDSRVSQTLPAAGRLQVDHRPHESAAERVRRQSDPNVTLNSPASGLSAAGALSDASINPIFAENNALNGFEHLAWLDSEVIQKLYRCLPDEPWALALSGASTQIQDHVLKCLPRSSAMLLQRRMDSLPAIRLRDVEDAQRRLADWIDKLDEPVDSH